MRIITQLAIIISERGGMRGKLVVDINNWSTERICRTNLILDRASLSFKFESAFFSCAIQIRRFPYPIVEVSTHTSNTHTHSSPTRNLTLGIFFSLITSSELRNAASRLCALFLPRRGISSTTFLSPPSFLSLFPSFLLDLFTFFSLPVSSLRSFLLFHVC